MMASSFVQGGGIIPAHAGSTQGLCRGCQQGTDHPRSRGEHLVGMRVSDKHLGSSPLTRGARPAATPTSQAGWIIPAHAGSTIVMRIMGERCRDHPRSRGEHLRSNPRGYPDLGSSPLTRGAQSADSLSCVPERIIPAHAGSTPRWQFPVPGPRGSSPLTRGARRDRQTRLRPQRIIPAHAGSTLASVHAANLDGDHPRSRGEHTGRWAGTLRSMGSSPLTRGAPASRGSPCGGRRDHPRSRGEHLIVFSDLPDNDGIIPAHAGSTCGQQIFAPGPTDHPRSRGEHDTGRHLRHAAGRIIPAHAGSTCSNWRMAASARDHPRSRGEHSWNSSASGRRDGSSPLTRGAPGGLCGGFGGDGIIPAHAGSTAASAPPRAIEPDHPRSRGEHRDCFERFRVVGGSSPLTRGAPVLIPPFALVGRDHPRSRGEHTLPLTLPLRVKGSSPLTRGARG